MKSKTLGSLVSYIHHRQYQMSDVPIRDEGMLRLGIDSYRNLCWELGLQPSEVRVERLSGFIESLALEVGEPLDSLDDDPTICIKVSETTLTWLTDTYGTLCRLHYNRDAFDLDDSEIASFERALLKSLLQALILDIASRGYNLINESLRNP